MSADRPAASVGPRRWRPLLSAGCLVTLAAAACGSADRGVAGAPVTDRRAADPTRCAVQHGNMVDGRFTSRSLGPQRFRIYLPPGYDATRRRYPVLYLLHGSGADETQWDDVGIGEAADCLLAAGRMAPLLIVLLDFGLAERRPDGATDVERSVTSEVLPTIDRRFRTLGDCTHRAIGGISLGGGWALRIAADHPDRFSAVGGHSPATGLTDAQRRALAGTDLPVWLDVGTNDGLRRRVVDLERRLTALHGRVTLHVWPGLHDRRYWSHHVQDYLTFYAAHL